MYNFDGLYDSYECTGFMIACDKNYIKIVEILIHKYPQVIDQKNEDDETGYMIACDNDHFEIV